MSTVKFYKGPESRIMRQSHGNGSIYVSTDTFKMYIDTEDENKKAICEDIIILPTPNDFPLAGLPNRFYYVKSTNSLFYNTGNSGYILINPSVPLIINNLNSTSTQDALSANMGRELNNKIGDIETVLSSLFDVDDNDN